MKLTELLPTPQASTRIADPASVDAAMLSRYSNRAFLPKPVARELLQNLLQVAGRAPSGTNTQPWKVYVLQGAKKDALIDQVVAAHNAIAADPTLAAQYKEEYDYYPEKWVSPYIDRRRECGFGLYGVLGLGKGDKPIGSFLFNEWRNGALLGGKAEDAYFVRCDRSTMTQNDLDNGRLVCLIGVAILKPAEFVIFRIGQKTADARA